MTVQLKERDVLPPMREDLVVVGTAHPTTGDLVSVRDPVSNRVIRMRGFELSLARLLDGKRTAREVLGAARGLGIPLSLAQLQNFGAKLSSVGFLGQAGGAAPGNKTTWQPRPLWSPEVREQFRGALKGARADRLEQARSYLEQVLHADPTVQDANELIAWIDERKRTLAVLASAAAPAPAAPPRPDPSSAVESEPNAVVDPNLPLDPRAPAPTPVDILAVPDDGPRPMKSFGEVFADADQGWYADVAAIEESLGPRKTSSRWPRRIASIVLAGVAAAALLVPLPRTVKTHFTLAAEDDVAITAPQAGAITALQATEGKWVEADDELLQLTTAGRTEKLAELEQRIAELEKRAAAAPAAPKKRSKGRSPQGEMADEVQRSLKKARVERQALLQRSDGTKVTALASGFVRGLAVKAGDTVEADATLCRIIASKRLVVKIAVPYGTPVAPGQRATLQLKGRTLEVTVESVNRDAAEATLDNADGALPVGGRGEAVVQLGKRSFWSL